MKRPTIGITTDYDEKRTKYALPYPYSASIERAGGLPVLLPYRSDPSLVPQYLDLLDGIVFTGGDDLNPRAYGEEYHPRVRPVDPAREEFERALMLESERRRIPALGICFGAQLMNIIRGGSMIQFLPEHDRVNAIEHRKGDNDLVWNRHGITVNAESVVGTTIGKREVEVNTGHQQGIKNIGRGLRVVAIAPDGVVEAIEDPSLPLWIGVQWHPERMSDEAEHFAFFKLLIEQASRAKFG